MIEKLANVKKVNSPQLPSVSFTDLTARERDVLGLICVLPFTRPLARRGVRAGFAGITRPYRDQADLLRAQMQPDTVVEGETVAEPMRPQPNRPRPDDPTVIKGEIEP